MSAHAKHIAGQMAKRYFKTHRDRMIFLRQMNAESGFEDLTSSAGASGYAQIMAGTARGWGVKNVHDPREAYAAAAKHMADYLKQTHGSWAGALQMYNLGHVSSSPPAETRNYIAKILGGGDVKAGQLGSGKGGGGAAKTGSRWSVKTGQQATFDQAGFEKAKKLAIVGQLIAKHHGTADNPLFTTGVLSTQMPSMSDFAGSRLTSSIEKTPIAGGGGGGGGGGVAGSKARSADAGNSLGRMQRLADAWDKAQHPYLWGGGHGSRPANPSQAVDCSGFVSAVLGVSPKVASAFKSWGKPGRGKKVTVWASDGHVLIQIGKKWYATSHSNPGGGAGRIAPPGSGYLSGFTPRHPRGM